MKRFNLTKIFLAAMLYLGTSIAANAQTAQIGFGTSTPANTLYSPIYRYSATSTTTHAISNIVYTAAEMAAAGITPGTMITSVQFNKTNAAEFTSPITFTMYVANTTRDSLETSTTWASILASHTQVFTSNSYNVPLAPGWVTINFSAPFLYTGGAFEVATNLVMAGNGGATDKLVWEFTDTIPTNRIIGDVGTTAQTTLGATVAAYKRRPNIRINYVPSAPCIDPPTAGTATTNNAQICSGAGITLGLTGNTFGSGQTHQWFSSATLSGGYTPIGSAGITPILNINPTTTLYYKCAVTCNTSTDTSAPVLVTVNPGLSGTYTINASLPASPTNFTSISAAVNALYCGVAGPVIFDIDSASGPYNEQVVIPQVTGTSSINTIKFNGNGAIVQFTPVTGARHIFKLDGADYIILNKLNIKSLATGFGWGIHLTNAANFDSILNCVIDVSAVTGTTQSLSAGIAASGSATTITTAGNNSNNLVVDSCTIVGGYQGIILNGLSSQRSKYNKITHNTIRHFYANGIEFTHQDSAFIYHNDINRATRVDVTTFCGIELGTNNKNVRINGNKIHDTHTSATTLSGTAYGIYFNSCDAPADSENVVTNNVIYNFNSSTGIQYGLYNVGSDGAKYFHNSVTLDSTTSTAGNTRGFFQNTAASNITLKNNLFHITRGGSGAKNCIYFGVTTSSIVSDNNALYINSTGGTNGVGYYGANFTDLTAWKTANGGIYDQSSVSADPQLVSANTGNLRPSAAAVNNIGAPVGVLTDILGTARSVTNPDPGAFEFSLGGCVSPPTAGTSTILPLLPVCAGDQVELGLTGHTTGSTQTYQWESSSNPGGPFTPVGTASILPTFNTTVNVTTYFRCAVTCNGITSYSAPVLAAVNAPLAGGTYTINTALPTGSGNFQTLAEAVAAVNCGIAGSIIFNMADGTYNNQVSIRVPFSNDSVIFQSASGNASLVNITAPSSTSGSFNYTISVSKTRNITFRNITVSRSGTNANSTVFNLDSTHNIRFYHVVMAGPVFTSANTTGTQSGIFSDDVNTEDSTIVSGCTFTNNSNGLWFFSSLTRPSVGTVIENNTFNTSYVGVFLKHQNAISIRKNIVTRAITGAFDFFGMSLENCKLNGEVSSNTINFDRGDGIRLLGSGGSSGADMRIINNMISAQQTGTNATSGVSIESNASYNATHLTLAHNTIVVNTTSATTGRAIYLDGATNSSAENLTIVNNILANTGAGYVYSISSDGIGSNIRFDRNNIYAAGSNIGTWKGTTGVSKDIRAWVNTTNQDSLSSTVAVNFVSTTDLHLTGTSLGDFNLATNITSQATADIDGTQRSNTYFYKGAHEGNVTLSSLSADAGAWSLVSPQPLSPNGNQDIVVKVRNNGLLPVTSVDVNHSLNGVTGSVFTWTGNLEAGKDTNLVIANINMPAGTNQIWVWTQNVNSIGGDLNPVNDTLKSTVVSAVPLNGNYTVGAGQNYANLTAVASALVNSPITGNLIFELAPSYSSTSESFPIIFTSPASSPYSVVIRPASGTTGAVTSGDPGSANALIQIDGASGITFDGRPGGNGTTSDWIFRNTRTATTYGSVFRLINGAQRNQFNYLTIESQSTSTTTGLVHFSTSSAGKGNSYNIVSNSLLRDRSDITAVTPAVSIYSSGTAANPNDSNVIDNNRISNFTTTGISVTATGNGNNWRITDNKFYYNSLNTPVATGTQTAINFIAESSGNLISGNLIGGSNASAGGTAWTNSGNNALIGINVTAGTGEKSVISNNIVKNIAKTGTGAASFQGIRVNEGRFSIIGNTIGDPLATNSITHTGTSNVFGITISNSVNTVDTVFVTNNTVCNITSTSISTGSRIRGINFEFTTDVSPLARINNNTVFNLSTTSRAIGINVDLISAVGIMVFPSTYHAGSEVNNNTVYNIHAASAYGSTTQDSLIVSCGIASSNFSGSLSNNTIYNIRNSSLKSGPKRSLAIGMYNRFLSGSKIANNMISMGSGCSDSVQVNGILVASAGGGGTHNYHHNSVVISSSAGNAVSSFAFHRGENNLSAASAQPLNLRNNLFDNQMTTAGNHYAIGIEDTAVILANFSNWNVLNSVNNANTALWGSQPRTLAAWKTVTGNDASSKQKQVFYNNITTGDLHLNGSSIGDVDLAGTNVPAAGNDFDGDVRPFTPYMGADEVLGFPVPVKMLVFNGNAIDNDALLTWKTAQEKNSAWFIVEASTDNNHFKEVGRVRAAGNTASPTSYRFTHQDANTFGNFVFYRLKITDLSGVFEYSDVVKVRFGSEVSDETVLTAYPNPFSQELTLKVASADAGKAHVEVYSLTGKLLHESHVDVNTGENLINLDELATLEPGLYFISYELNGHKQTYKVIRAK